MLSYLGKLPSLLDIIGAICHPWRARAKAMATPRLGNRLKVARAERNISQEELAKLVGVTRQTISSIETGQYCPSTLLAFLLSTRLEKHVDELFFLEEVAK
jgi:putative transcriptional regulator